MVEFHGYEDDSVTPAFDAAYLRRLWPFVRPYRAGFLACLGILAVSFGLEVLGPYLLRLTIDGPVQRALEARGAGAPGDPAGARTAILGLGLAYLAVSALGSWCSYGFTVLTARNGQLVIRDLRIHLFDHLLHLDLRYYDKNPTGRLVTRLTSDVENLNELIATGVLQTVFDLLKIFGILAVLFVLDVRLALYTVAATPVIVLTSLAFRKLARAAYRKVRGRLARQNAFTAELVGGIRATRAFDRNDTVQAHFDQLNRRTRLGWRSTIFYFALFFSLVDLALRWGQVGLLWVGGSGILAGTLSAGVFVQFWLYFTKLTDPIKQLGEKYNVLQSALSSSERIFHILDQEPAPVERPDPRPSRPGPARLRFEAVSFAYRPSTPVLHGVDFEVEPATTCAIVGPTGAGKSTILALCSRLYDPSAGTVLVDGDPLPELELRSLRRRIAVVQQDVFLFSGSVLDNIRLFDDSISAARARDALEAVGALAFVESLEGGLDAPVEERGATLSQGERQLLSFARALASEPDILLLDEATANVDSRSEEQIQRALRTLLAERTCLVVAHRLSTVRHADQILVVQGGRIVERGRHDELVRRRGAYASMLAAVSA